MNTRIREGVIMFCVAAGMALIGVFALSSGGDDAGNIASMFLFGGGLFAFGGLVSVIIGLSRPRS